MYQIKFKSHIKLPFRNLSYVSEKTAPFLSLERSNRSTKLWPNLHYSINYAYTLLKQETSSFARKKIKSKGKKFLHLFERMHSEAVHDKDPGAGHCWLWNHCRSWHFSHLHKLSQFHDLGCSFFELIHQ